MPEAEKICLFLVPTTESESDTIEWLDKVYGYIVVPAAEKCGYKPMRTDRLPGPSKRTTSKISDHLREDSMVVADLTGFNPNILYEVGHRHALEKQVILLAQKGHLIPFDLFDFPIIFVELNVDAVNQSKRLLIEKIKEAEEEEL